MKNTLIYPYLIAVPMAAATLAFPAFIGHCGSPLYPSVVEGDRALGYYRFNDSLVFKLAFLG